MRKRVTRKRAIFLSLTVALVVGITPTPGYAAGEKDAQGPACSDIAGTAFGYTATKDQLLLIVRLVDAPCEQVTYTADLYTPDGTLVPAQAAVERGEDRILFRWTPDISWASYNYTLCYEASTVLGPQHVADYSPDRNAEDGSRPSVADCKGLRDDPPGRSTYG